ncbi:MAG: IclR family transcriptional regulator [Rhodococcus sp. (in: high G+C Gram-positive bacteria)]
MAQELSVRVLERAFQVLDCFSPREPRLHISDLRSRTGLPTTTVARLVKTLVAEALLERDGDEYRLGLRVLVWGAPATAGSDLIAAGTPVIEYIRDVTRESTGIYIRQGSTRVAVASVQSDYSIVYRGYVGQVMPLHAGSAGKVFMAFDAEAREAARSSTHDAVTPPTRASDSDVDIQLDEIRERGWAFTSEEREAGLNSLAAPVFGATGRIVAALAVGGPAFRLTAGEADKVGPLVATAALSLSQRLGYTGHLVAPPMTEINADAGEVR